MIVELKYKPYKKSEHKCYVCHKVKRLESFSKDKNKPGGIGYKCKKCNAKNVYGRTKNKHK